MRTSYFPRCKCILKGSSALCGAPKSPYRRSGVESSRSTERALGKSADAEKGSYKWTEFLHMCVMRVKSSVCLRGGDGRLLRGWRTSRNALIAHGSSAWVGSRATRLHYSCQILGVQGLYGRRL